MQILTLDIMEKGLEGIDQRKSIQITGLSHLRTILQNASYFRHSCLPSSYFADSYFNSIVVFAYNDQLNALSVNHHFS